MVQKDYQLRKKKVSVDITSTDIMTPDIPVDVITDKLVIDDLITADFTLTSKTLSPPPPPSGDPGLPPANGWFEQLDKNANKDPTTWKVIPMVKDPNLSKVIDDKGINRAVEFKTSAAAQQYIAHFVWLKNNSTPTPTPTPTPPPSGDKDQFGITKVYPDKPGGRSSTAFTLEKKIRNYSSGKPSEPSVEYTNDSGSQPIRDAEFTHYVKINGFKTHEPDSISNKMRGGIHSSSDPIKGTCYDLGLRTDGNTDKNLQIERPHPKMHDANQPTHFKLGQSIVKKWIGIKGITYNLPGDAGVHIETLIDFPVPDIEHPPNRWAMYINADDTGQLEEGKIIKPFGSKTTCRIDGVWKQDVYELYIAGKLNRKLTNDDVDPPDFRYASIREIVPR